MSGEYDDLDLGATLKGFVQGQKLSSRYMLSRILGQGGMGVVWLARDGELGRDIAMKFLPEMVIRDPEAVADLKRETNRSLELTHPNIVRIYDFVQGGNWAGISMEYVEGDTLSALKVDQPGGCFDTEQIAPWVGSLCAALVYAHEDARVVHRDLKPANLMLAKSGKFKVADFGIARSLSESATRISMRPSTGGTLVYMSPQQAMGEEPSVSDDIYALGATMYDLLTGKPPFHSGDVMTQLREKIPVSMTERRSRLQVTGKNPIPENWEQTIAACLEKDPAKRPQSAGEVACRLGLVENYTAQPKAETPPKPPVIRVERETKPEPKRGNGALIALLLLLLGCGAAAGWWYGYEQPRREAESQAQIAEQAQKDSNAAKAKEDAQADEKHNVDAATAAAAVNKSSAVIVLCYHDIEDDKSSPQALPTGEFAREMQTLKDNGINVIGMQDFLAWRRGEKAIPAKSALITMDDGWISAHDNAWPILKKFNYPFSLFISIDYIGTGGKLMSWEQLAEMRDAGVDIESHSYSHSNLEKPGAYVEKNIEALVTQDVATLGLDGWLHKEVAGSKQELEKQLGIKVDAFAYPFGIYNEKVRAMVKEAGYEAAFTVYGQPLRANSPYDLLGRYAVDPGHPEIFTAAMNDIAGNASDTAATAENQGLETPKKEDLAKSIAEATKDQPWENSLGMRFVPVPGTKVLFSIWDTRVQDYEKFVTETGRPWTRPDFEQGPTHPAVNVSWEDANAFCKWLTEKESKEGEIGADQGYRLPTDEEWSAAVGLPEEAGSTPAEKDSKYKGVYPWGDQWPPPKGAGNYDPSLKVDDYEYTSPAGSFAANQYGLYDMGGNVFQWCEDWYNSTHTARVQRGSSWRGVRPFLLISSFRLDVTPDGRLDGCGFRCVLATSAEVAAEKQEVEEKPKTEPSEIPPSATPVPKKSTPSNSVASITPAPGGGPGLVWVNTTSHVYHKQGSKWYGMTKYGNYMSEAEAIKEGNVLAAGEKQSADLPAAKNY